MTTLELFIIAVGLSMDAFAVAVCKGLSLKKASIKACVTVSLYFGILQALMPLIGFTVGSYFAESIKAIDHWIAFILLGFIGGNMVRGSFNKEECPPDQEWGLDFREMLLLAIATSIDALAVGVSFAFLSVDIVPAVSFIGIVTFTLSAAGVMIGNMFGMRFKSKAELVGGMILIVMGVKILLEHLNYI